MPPELLVELRPPLNSPGALSDHQFFGPFHRQRGQQHLVQEGEDRRVGANPQPDRQNDDQAEQRRLRQAAKGESKSCHIYYIRLTARKCALLFDEKQLKAYWKRRR